MDSQTVVREEVPETAVSAFQAADPVMFLSAKLDVVQDELTIARKRLARLDKALAGYGIPHQPDQVPGDIDAQLKLRLEWLVNALNAAGDVRVEQCRTSHRKLRRKTELALEQSTRALSAARLEAKTQGERAEALAKELGQLHSHIEQVGATDVACNNLRLENSVLREQNRSYRNQIEELTTLKEPVVVNTWGPEGPTFKDGPVQPPLKAVRHERNVFGEPTECRTNPSATVTCDLGTRGCVVTHQRVVTP